VPLNRDQVLHEAMRLVDDEGVDALSLRTLATRLGVQAPTLYWHIKNKAALLDALADAIMDEAIGAVPAPAADGGDAREWLLAALGQLRAAMLRHRDGARIVSGARNSMRRGDFSELAMATLVAHGTDLHHARLLVLAGERYTVGWVLEEQSPAVGAPDIDVDAMRARFPTAVRGITEYFSAGRTAEDLYRDIARLVLHLPDETR
jgi:TetR/AcrR family tetracycline transcriptional repressor